jgi:hypothetical protein
MDNAQKKSNCMKITVFWDVTLNGLVEAYQSRMQHLSRLLLKSNRACVSYHVSMRQIFSV